MNAQLKPVPATTAANVQALINAKGMELISGLLKDPNVNDILINGCDAVFVEMNGKLRKTDIVFPNEETVRELAESICQYVGRELSRARPLVDARLPDGSRVNIVAPPLAVDGTSISIRKFSLVRIGLDDMVAAGNISEKVAELFKMCGRCRLNMVISGGTGSGKTTLLNAISQYIDDHERVITIEDSAELKLQKPHVVRMETRPVHQAQEIETEIGVRDLVKNALRMRPDRIIVGEVRGGEAFDMLQAMNTGHEGSLATIHANHPRDALMRLENMVNIAGVHIPQKALRGQIASALHLVIQISRMRDGVRRVTFVSEVVGMEAEVITMQDLVVFKQTGEKPDGTIIGDWNFTGISPRFARRVAYWGEQERFSRIFGSMAPRF